MDRPRGSQPRRARPSKGQASSSNFDAGAAETRHALGTEHSRDSLEDDEEDDQDREDGGATYPVSNIKQR